MTLINDTTRTEFRVASVKNKTGDTKNNPTDYTNKTSLLIRG